MKLVKHIQDFFEEQAYGVCEWWGTKFNVNTGAIRVYFIYLSFLTLGSPLVIYLAMAFVLKNKNWFKPKRSTIWEL
ncbi:MAG: phage shock protein C [Salibacteraceae bacterium]|jgi:phage shock protein PspC (stress-responsive transcriptional regulator)